MKTSVEYGNVMGGLGGVSRTVSDRLVFSFFSLFQRIVLCSK